MTIVTNTAEGPRGVIVSDGKDAEGKIKARTHYLEPNESADLDLHPDHELYEGVVTGKAAAKAAAKEAEAAAEEVPPTK